VKLGAAGARGRRGVSGGACTGLRLGRPGDRLAAGSFGVGDEASLLEVGDLLGERPDRCPAASARLQLPLAADGVTDLPAALAGCPASGQPAVRRGR
jgi:hypothetical protein